MFKYKNISNTSIVLLVDDQLKKIVKGEIFESINPLNYSFLVVIDKPPINNPKEIQNGHKTRSKNIRLH